MKSYTIENKEVRTSNPCFISCKKFTCQEDVFHSMGKIREKLYNRLSEKPHPLFVFKNSIIPAATIWVGVRAWVKVFREHKIEPGDRIILSYEESPAFVHIVFASIWEGLTLIILKPNSIHDKSIEFFDAKLIISGQSIPYSIQPDNMGLPQEEIEIRKTYLAKSIQTRFILQTSGSTGNSKFVCLEEDAIYNVIQTHSKIFESNKTSALSILPWSHCFGLVLDLLMCTMYSEMIVRDPESGKRTEPILELFAKYETNHFSSVPLVIERILQNENGLELLQKLQSGIIGGAPITKRLSEKLKTTKLCVGYGQTEASPGICLGEKGVFYENFIGSPIGCETRINKKGELEFKGDNALVGYWQEGKIDIIPQDGWISTGDIVQEKTEGLFFVGRLNFSFKLPNGIMIQPEIIEKEILLGIKQISKCMIFFKKQIHFLFSIESKNQKEEIIEIIRRNLPPFLKNADIKFELILEDKWIYFPKGEINRIAMIEKASNL